MTNAQAIAVILRLFGLWLVLGSLISALYAVPSLLTFPSFIAVTESILLLSLGAWLSLRPLGVAQILLPSAAADEATANWSVDEFQAVLFSALGMYFLVGNLTDLTTFIQAVSSVQDSIRVGAEVNIYFYSQITSFVLRLVVGVWLLLGAKGLRRILKKLRS